jgi:MFS family permease
MLRSILAVVVGYIVVAALVMLTFTPAFFAPELVFETDGIGITLPFLVFSLAMGAVAAVLGGIVSALIAGMHAWRAALALVAIVFVLGVASAVHGLFRVPATVSAEEVTRMTPMEKAAICQEPVWYSFLLPFLVLQRPNR